jgi:hypothetical protein
MRVLHVIGSASIVLTAVVACAASTGGAAAPAAASGPIAVELFTSQGCSSCPPADAVMEKLARDRGIVAISRPVTYWDSGGWKDTLARPANTALQRAYAQRRFSGAGVYTPQMVIEGRAGAVGGREDQVRRLINEAARLPRPALAIASPGDGSRTIRVSGVAPTAAQLTLVALRAPVTVSVGNGENSGRHVTYVNTVISERPLGTWNGGARTIAIPARALQVAGAARYALLLRQGTSGPIFAARYL